MSAAPKMPGIEMTPADFFHILFPNAEDLAGHLNLYTLPGKRSEWFAPSELDTAATRAVQLGQTKNVYYGFGLVDRVAREQEARAERIRRGETAPKIDLGYIRGSNTTITAIPGYCHDADIFDLTAHKKTALPLSADEIMALYETTFPGMPPTLVILSGRGLHSYWLFEEAYALETPQERDDMGDALYRFQGTINKRGKDLHGWALDGTADLAHIFRPPDTFNHKGGQPVPVHALMMSGRRYNRDSFDSFLIDVAWMPKGKADPVSLAEQLEAVDDLAALGLKPWLVAQIIDGNEELTDDDGKPMNRYPSRNEAVWRIENELAEAGLPDDTIAAILLDPRYGISSKPLEQRNPRQWIAADLGRMRKWQEKKPKGPTIIGDVEDFKSGETDQRRNGHAAASPVNSNDLPEIMTSGRQLRDITRDALGALNTANDPPVLYVQRGQVARVRTDEQGRPVVDVLTTRNLGPLRGRMERVANFTRWQKAKGSEFVKAITTPPTEVVIDLLSLPGWSFPPLRGVIEAPALRPDGTIITCPGYDHATGLLYIPADGLVVPPIPDHPTREDAIAARAKIEEAIGEFPYADDSSAANAFAATLTPTVRPAIRGNVPLCLFNKPRAGSGASLHVEVIGRITTGRPPTLITAPKTEEEFRKKLTSVIVDDPTGIVVLDNLEATLVSESLAAILTASEWSDRTLGTNTMARVQVRWTPLATGNNVRLGGDLPRRVYEVRLDPKVARPWTRSGFRHDDLPEWVMQHRGELLAAVLTMARAWYAAGKPKADVPKIGGFDEWAQTLGGILAYAGIEGFLSNLVQLWESNDEEANEWEAFLGMWSRIFGTHSVTVGTLATRFQESRGLIDECLPTSLVDAWAESTSGAGGSFKKKLGKALAKHTDTIFGPYRLKNAGKDPTTKLTLWAVELVEDGSPTPPPDGGNSGADAANSGPTGADPEPFDPERTPEGRSGSGVSDFGAEETPEPLPDKNGPLANDGPEFPEFTYSGLGERKPGDENFSGIGASETNSGNSGEDDTHSVEESSAWEDDDA